MDDFSYSQVLVYGNDKVAFSIAVCMLKSGHSVIVLTDDKKLANRCIRQHLNDLSAQNIDCKSTDLVIMDVPQNMPVVRLAIAVTREIFEEKSDVIKRLELCILPTTPLLINAEAISLNELQTHAQHRSRIIGANWVEPVHTTLFLELIVNEHSDEELWRNLESVASRQWNKDPYVVTNTGIRSQLLGAFLREACYLIANEYSTIEDIDRACRNDPGYYLPFAGNFRYMDLMGTRAYGLVMKDLNRNLSNESQMPAFFEDMITKENAGMDSGTGFYNYSAAERENWNMLSRIFSYDIESIIRKYKM